MIVITKTELGNTTFEVHERCVVDKGNEKVEITLSNETILVVAQHIKEQVSSPKKCKVCDGTGCLSCVRVRYRTTAILTEKAK